MCRHAKDTFSYSGGPDTTYKGMEKAPGGTPGYYWEYQNHHLCACTSKATAIAAAKAATGIDPYNGAYLGGNGQALINAAWLQMKPDLTELSVPNFLAELDDVKSLYKLWKKNASLVKNVAGLHLNYKFGWKPTMGDLSALIDSLVNLRSAIKRFEDSLGTIVKKMTSPVNDSFYASGSFAWPSAGSTTTWRATGKRQISAYAAYAPQPLAVMGGADKILRGIIDSLGFELNPRIIWDALPFTFVVDWFFGVGSWLERFKVDALELPIHLVDCYLQMTEELEVEWEWQRGNADQLFANPPRSGGCRYTEKFFHRMPIFPDFATFSGLGWKLPSANQATLLVSLIAVLNKGK